MEADAEHQEGDGEIGDLVDGVGILDEAGEIGAGDDAGDKEAGDGLEAEGAEDGGDGGGETKDHGEITRDVGGVGESRDEVQRGHACGASVSA